MGRARGKERSRVRYLNGRDHESVERLECKTIQASQRLEKRKSSRPYDKLRTGAQYACRSNDDGNIEREKTEYV